MTMTATELTPLTHFTGADLWGGGGGGGGGLRLRSDCQVWSMSKNLSLCLVLATPFPSKMPGWYLLQLDPWQLSLKYLNSASELPGDHTKNMHMHFLLIANYIYTMNLPGYVFHSYMCFIFSWVYYCTGPYLQFNVLRLSNNVIIHWCWLLLLLLASYCQRVELLTITFLPHSTVVYYSTNQCCNNEWHCTGDNCCDGNASGTETWDRNTACFISGTCRKESLKMLLWTITWSIN